MGKKTLLQLQDWVEARKRHHLSHAHVQMARELGMNPAKLGKLDNHRQEPWKAPLPQFIEALYEKRFGRERPENVLSIEELAKQRALKKEARRDARAQDRAALTEAAGVSATGVATAGADADDGTTAGGARDDEEEAGIEDERPD